MWQYSSHILFRIGLRNSYRWRIHNPDMEILVSLLDPSLDAPQDELYDLWIFDRCNELFHKCYFQPFKNNTLFFRGSNEGTLKTAYGVNSSTHSTFMLQWGGDGSRWVRPVYLPARRRTRRGELSTGMVLLLLRKRETCKN